MAIDPYTHKFDFTVNGQFIRGELELNTDKKMSLKVTEWSQPLMKDEMEYFLDIIEQARAIMELSEEGEITKILIKKKGVGGE